MIEVIQREEGKQSVKEQLERGKPQISYNSDGHLVIRLIHDFNRDTLVVLDCNVSNKVREFCQLQLSNSFQKEKIMDIPF